MIGKWVLCVALLAGCPKYTTYGYDYRMSQQLGLSEDPTPPSVEARKLLQSAKTVAFYPPQGCLNTEMVNLGANSVEERRRMQELRASCGVLMSSLERAAESAGYEVMSWQNLNGQKRPIEYAREANVDVLFEINAFTPEQLDASQVKHTLSFFEVTDSKTLDLTVNPVTARRCKNDADTSIKLQIAGYTGTIDIKTVSVVDGRDRWHYRRVQQVPVAERHDPHVTFTGKRKANKLAALLRVIGAIGVGAGSGLLLAEIVSTDDPLTPENEKFSSGYTYPTLIVGALFLAAGITVDVAIGGPKPDTDATLCNPDATGVTVARGRARASAGPTESRSEYTYHEEEQSEIDTKVKQQIQNDMIAGFVTTLKEVRAQVPQQAAPPAPDAGALTTPPPGAPPGQP